MVPRLTKEHLLMRSVAFSHSKELPCKFSVNVEECQEKLPTMYWLPKLHKNVKS